MVQKSTMPGTIANNKPVGGAGQPFGNLKKEVPDSRAGAIARRLEAKKKKKDANK